MSLGIPCALLGQSWSVLRDATAVVVAVVASVTFALAATVTITMATAATRALRGRCCEEVLVATCIVPFIFKKALNILASGGRTSDLRFLQQSIQVKARRLAPE
jgi:branched-subunit amino acid ABC-type transport system permease component